MTTSSVTEEIDIGYSSSLPKLDRYSENFDLDNTRSKLTTNVIDTSDVKHRVLKFRHSFRSTGSSKPSKYITPSLSSSSSSFRESTESHNLNRMTDGLKGKVETKGISRLKKRFFPSRTTKIKAENENEIMLGPNLLDNVICGMQDDICGVQGCVDDEKPFDSKEILLELRKDAFWSQFACDPAIEDDERENMDEKRPKSCCMSIVDKLCCVDDGSE